MTSLIYTTYLSLRSRNALLWSSFKLRENLIKRGINQNKRRNYWFAVYISSFLALVFCVLLISIMLKQF